MIDHGNGRFVLAKVNIENNVKKHTNLLALHQNAQKANFRVTETWRGGQITCNGAQDSSWQRGRQAISRSISSKESNRSIIIRNPSGKVHIFRRCYITQLICSTCNNWSTTRMNLETCFFVLFLITLFWQSYIKG